MLLRRPHHTGQLPVHSKPLFGPNVSSPTGERGFFKGREYFAKSHPDFKSHAAYGLREVSSGAEQSG